jgi:hypothetical protein
MSFEMLDRRINLDPIHFCRAGKSISTQAYIGPDGYRRLRLPGFSDDTRRWQGCQPYAPAVFIPK